MKTFKIVALQIIDQQQTIDIPLTDGLIINKESEDGIWIIEAYIEKRLKKEFQSKYENKETFEVRVVITHQGNDPAPFTAEVITIREFDSHISVLLQGKLRRKRIEHLELLLEKLIKEGYSGEALTIEFKKRMKAKQT
ncbi:YwpF-like family protein [Lederbergia sp. NSJ-179]|uniref:YwpF-like family protein n=1 Tax=Lederbergia sp. NSJ-179 TaxID=2931402 RepID=UPI001FD1427E|nr:YwpF-like family protein [Lederbergia sp. NSJ-179]MCJ7840598.1 YwpF-like family protein [Lederbergia sp. NSJ-179]